MSIAPAYLQQAKKAKQQRADLRQQFVEDGLLKEQVTTMILNETDALADAVFGQGAQQQVMWVQVLSLRS
ncbi:MAG: hypothetical protein H6765_06885 [Candidatus Peribacteria bacterium]|nr:MAG: hypothetical protein H6765_06885 [Candidatus Peribacteria bacterium]